MNTIKTRKKYSSLRMSYWRNERAKKKFPELAKDPDTVFINGVAFTFKQSPSNLGDISISTFIRSK